MKIAVLTSSNQWFESYVGQLSESWNNVDICNHHDDLPDACDIVFILGYHQIIPRKIRAQNRHNIVIHESSLPKGKGWAPLFWQVLEGMNEITFSMIEASDKVDSGDIYMQKKLKLTGFELNKELRRKQAETTIEMCLEFVRSYQKYKVPVRQVGGESFYEKRNREDSKLDVDKTIREQFNLLRVVNNDEYPAFFEIDGNRYVVEINKDISVE